MGRPSVYACMPLYNDLAHGAAALALCPGYAAQDCDIHVKMPTFSHPEHAFNDCWAAALNSREMHGLTHFAMLHSDVVPEPGWLDKLLALQAETDADLVSVVIPIKNPSGNTSTALGVPFQDGRAVSVLNLRQVFALPETFGPDAFPGRVLFLNTGCFVARFDRDWCHRVWSKAKTWIGGGGGRGYVAHFFPSDWDFSLQVQNLGGKVLATRAVRCYHGKPEYTNAHPWGLEGVTEGAA